MVPSKFSCLLVIEVSCGWYSGLWMQWRKNRGRLSMDGGLSLWRLGDAAC